MGLEENLSDAIIDLNEQKAYSLVEKFLEKGRNPNHIIELIHIGMDVIGKDKKWIKEAGTYVFIDNAFEGVKIIKKWVGCVI